MATLSIKCGICGEGVAATVVTQSGLATFLLCPSCQEGSVRVSSGAIYPSAPAGGNVTHLADDVAQAWREARTAHAVAAYTASEIMCRKILMHVAVDAAGSAAGRKFVEYVDDLETSGYITTGLKPVVDRIRARGNGAAHELAASTEEDSLTTIKITEHLLRSVYELPNI